MQNKYCWLMIHIFSYIRWDQKGTDMGITNSYLGKTQKWCNSNKVTNNFRKLCVKSNVQQVKKPRLSCLYRDTPSPLQ